MTFDFLAFNSGSVQSMIQLHCDIPGSFLYLRQHAFEVLLNQPQDNQVQSQTGALRSTPWHNILYPCIVYPSISRIADILLLPSVCSISVQSVYCYCKGSKDCSQNYVAL